MSGQPKYDPEQRAALRQQYLGMPDEFPMATPPATSRTDRGRIVVTLNYVVPKAWRERFGYPLNVDAVDVLRHVIEEYDEGKLALADLVAMAADIKIEVGK